MTFLTLMILNVAGAADGVEVANDAVKGVSIQTLIIAIVGSGTFTTWLSWFLSRRKQGAETGKTEAEADNIVASTYNQILEDLRLELIRERDHSTQRINEVEQDCTRRIASNEEDNRRKYAAVVERLSYLEQREAQATEHIKNLETALRELGVPLPPTPWRPLRR